MSRTSLNNVKSIFAPLALALFVGTAMAGSVTPPAGPVANTMKTLTEVEPRIAINATNTPGVATAVFVISQPGSYYLTGPVAVAAGKDGIYINSPDVTIDLNGYTVFGQTNSEYGISSNNMSRVTIRNGRVQGFRFDGIRSIGRNTVIENVIALNCGGSGISIGSGSIRNCQADLNGLSGIRISDFTEPSIVENCTARDNVGSGIDVNNGAVRGCVAVSNTYAGIQVSTGTIADCTATENAVGLRLEAGVVADSVAQDNTTTGILVNGNALVRGNSVTANTIGANTIGVQVQNSAGARIENNQITRMNTGINCLTANNLVVGNSFRGCNNAFNVLAGNRIGTIVTGAASPAIIGNTGGGLGTTDPLANIIH